MLSSDLLAVLACPESKAPLLYAADGTFLFCPTSRLRYRVEGGIPVLLIEEAERISEEESVALVARLKGQAGA